MYKVIHFFTDLRDNSHPYNVGEKFPREGVSVSAERLEELSGKNNLQGKPLIKLADDDFSQYMNAPEETVENNSYSKEEISKMSVAKLRELANEKGIDSADKSKSELKKILMEI